MCRPDGDSLRARTRYHFAFLIVASLGAMLCGGRTSGQCPPPPSTLVESQISSDATSATVAIRQCGEFIIAIATKITGTFGQSNHIQVQRFNPDGSPLGSPANLTSSVPGEKGTFEYPSISMSRSGRVFATWVGKLTLVPPQITTTSLHRLAFDFDAFTFTPLPASDTRAEDYFASAGTSDAALDATSWTNQSIAPGLHAHLLGSADQIIRNCEPSYCGDRRDKWRSAVSARSEDGYVGIVFAYDEFLDVFQAPRNIALLVFSPDGQLLVQDSRNGPDINDPAQWVNSPPLEDPTSEDDSDQRSPAVSFVGDDIVVAWVGPATQECFDGANHIYARRFKFDAGAQAGQKLRDPLPASGEGRAGMFVVDTDSDATVHAVQPNPAVALTLATDDKAGRFIVAWNAAVTSLDREEVRAQFFDGLGQPRGGPFRVNQATAITDPSGPNTRLLDRSAAHTVAYGADDQAVIVWSPYVSGDPQGVYYTLLPPNYALTSIPACGDCEMNPELCDPCLKGDVNDDCLVNLFDIPLFVDALLFGDFTCSDILDCAGMTQTATERSTDWTSSVSSTR